MQREQDEEEDEIQVYRAPRIPEEKRHYQGMSSSVITKQRRQDDDSFTKRLGQRSKSTLRDRTSERTNAYLTTSKTADASRRTRIHEIPRACKCWRSISLSIYFRG